MYTLLNFDFSYAPQCNPLKICVAKFDEFISPPKTWSQISHKYYNELYASFLVEYKRWSDRRAVIITLKKDPKTIDPALIVDLMNKWNIKYQTST